MAERRMFAKTIIDSDAFLDMSVTARLLYYDLSMRADDDGFVNSPKKIMRMIGASEDDLRMLAARKFIIPFDNGVVVIKHWKIHNYIKNDRYKETPYKEQKALLELDENKAYRLNQAPCIQDGYSMDTERIQDGYSMDTQVRVRLGKDSIGNNNILPDSEPQESKKPKKHKYGTYKNVLLTDEELEKLKADFPDYQRKIETLSEGIELKGYKYKSHYLAIRKWAQRDSETRTAKPDESKNKFNNFEQREYDYDALERQLMDKYIIN